MARAYSFVQCIKTFAVNVFLPVKINLIFFMFILFHTVLFVISFVSDLNECKLLNSKLFFKLVVKKENSMNVRYKNLHLISFCFTTA